MAKIKVLDTDITIVKQNSEDYISLTDMAKSKNPADANEIIRNWLRNRNTIEFLGIWEKIYNSNFNTVEFDRFKKEAGLNSFTLSSKKWVEKTNAIGIVSKAGRYGGTYAHPDIAFEFGMWISAEFKIYLVKEFQRLKNEELQQLGWNIKRNLTKINYKIHTNAIKENLIPKSLTPQQINFVYANEADIFNVALFGMTAKEWLEKNGDKKGNIRDEANVYQLVCLANLESLNAHLINEGLSQSQRLQKLNEIAISQMQILAKDDTVKKLKSK